MPTAFEYSTCEPFRAWNRLEPRARRDDFERVLKAEIHDPLWMLTRQWQFGEFKGEDTGSAILAKIKLETSRICKYKLRNEVVADYDPNIPLEAIVESEPMPFDYRQRVLVGQRWLKILDQYGGADFNKKSYLEKYISDFPLELPVLQEEEDASIKVQKARVLANAELKQFLRAVSGRAFDGIQLLQTIHEVINGLKPLSLLTVDHTHWTFINPAMPVFTQWCGHKFAAVTNQSSAWNPSQLEYQFSCALPNKEGDNTVLKADEYYQGKVDWYAFDVEDPENNNVTPVLLNPEQKGVHTEIISVIPSEAEFGGMPNTRWWEFEDSEIDLGNIKAQKTDVAKILLSEFALIYSNDWFLVPYAVPVGSLSQVAGIVVTDVFGQKTFIQAVNQGQTDDWSGWGMFNLSNRRSDPENLKAADTRLFIPPSLPKVQESTPYESVHFVRDEMANLVWAVESKVQDLLGKGMDGHAAAAELQLLMEGVKSIIPAIPEAMYKYILSNTVPENWIPFMAVHVDADNRAIQLQRASMPREVEDEFLQIRPRTDILRQGMSKLMDRETRPFSDPNVERSALPYFINEEEVPKAGIEVYTTHQRARWYNGRIFHWRGRRKIMGRGEGSSGLQFDHLEFLKKQED